MSKRKPPSQRPERKMDETARAIARTREKAADAAETERQAAEPKVKPHGPEAGHAGKRPGGLPAPAAIRRRKTV